MNAAHLHLLFYHLPIVGLAVGLLFLCGAITLHGDRRMFLASVLVLVISGVVGLAAQLLGESAADDVPHLPKLTEELIEITIFVSSVTTLIALVATTVIGGVMAWAHTTGRIFDHRSTHNKLT